MATFNGNLGIVKIGTRTLCVTGWTANVETESLDSTGTCDAGYRARTAGLSQATGSVRINLDDTDSPLGGSPAIAPGSTVALYLYWNATAIALTVPVAYIPSVGLESAVGAITTLTFNFESSGSYTLSSDQTP